MIRVLHFADAHIDMSTQGRHDPKTGLPLRVLDFLKALDSIIDAAIDEKVDLVIFSGDAYKDRTPVPTFQRESGRRILRLSQGGIRTILLVGNHDLSPAAGRAHALHEFQTLKVPNINVIDRPCLLTPENLGGLPVQVIGLPWISRSGVIAALNLSGNQTAEVYQEMETRMQELVDGWLKQVDPSLPVIMTAHASVAGAMFGFERSVMLGNDLVLPLSLVRDPRLDYVALGHIHKAQNLNEGGHPPVIYPGSIETVDFSEVQDGKYYVIASIEHGKTAVEWCKLEGRRFIDRTVTIKPGELEVQQRLMEVLPSPDEMEDAIVRLVVEYPRDLESLMDETALRRYVEKTFEFHFVRRPQVEGRGRIGDSDAIGSLSVQELLDIYWKTTSSRLDQEEVNELIRLAEEITSAGIIGDAA